MKTSLLFGTLLVASALHAAPRTGVRYALSAESVGAAAGTASSARYRATGHVGAVGALRFGPAAAVRAGFAGMLADPTGLTLRSGFTELAENTSAALRPFVVLDDSTLLAVAAGSVTWSVLDGPVQIDAGGVVSAPLLYSDRTATIGAAHAGFSTQRLLNLRNVGVDDFGSYAADGLDDGWQVVHFGEHNPLASPTADPDGDRQDNRFEQRAGTVPTQALSAFRVRIEGVPGSPAARRLVFDPLIAGRTYTLERTVTLGAAVSWQPVAGALLEQAGAQGILTDPAGPAPMAFYRVAITEP